MSNVVTVHIGAFTFRAPSRPVRIRDGNYPACGAPGESEYDRAELATCPACFATLQTSVFKSPKIRDAAVEAGYVEALDGGWVTEKKVAEGRS